MTDAVIYLDHAATTPIVPSALDAMAPWLSGVSGNPHAANHHGRRASEAADGARRRVAAALNAHAAEIVFTSGATEANNLAVKGAALAGRAAGRDHVVTTATEHLSVLESGRWLEARGCRLTVLPVDRDGLVRIEDVSAALDRRTALVSVMAVNNETGVIQPIAEIARIVTAAGALFHTDAVQAMGRLPLDVRALSVDLLSLSGHKIGGPMGIGALYVRRKPPVDLEPMLSGGAQQAGLRPGTLPTALAVGFGAAADWAAGRLAAEAERQGRLRERFLRPLGPVQINGALAPHLASVLSLTFPGVRGEDLMDAVPGLSLSTGAACSSAKHAPSHVLTAMGLAPEEADATIRVSFGWSTTEAEVDRAAYLLKESLDRLGAGRATLASAPVLG
ncbi:MAG TPA: cysteine desulfurase family protein [Alphaproteobacteria bacterium]|nr:cysteine desulfurase family protein [Alphaproteobacteria bacterium]